MEVFVGLEFDDGEAAAAVEGEQIEQAAVAHGERGDLGVKQIAAEAGEQLGNAAAQPRLKPVLGLHAEERIGVRAVGVAAEEEAGAEVAAEGFALRGERSFVCACAEGEFVLAGEGVGGGGVVDAGELEAVEEQADLSGGGGTNLDAVFGRGGEQGEQVIDSLPAALDGGCGTEGMDEARLEVAGVAEVDGGELLTALVEGEELEVGGGVVEPGHALGGGAPGTGGDDDFEATEVASAVAVLAAVMEPEDAKGENAVDDGGGLGLGDADDGVCGGAAEEASADVGGAEAMFEVHGRAQGVDFRADEVAGEHALKQALVVAAGGIAGGRGAAVAGGDEFEGLRLGRAHAAGDEAQAGGALLGFNDGADEVALFAPELEEAAAMLLGDGVACRAHVKEDAAIFEECGGGVVGEILFNDFGELGRRGSNRAGSHATSPAGRGGW